MQSKSRCHSDLVWELQIVVTTGLSFLRFLWLGKPPFTVAASFSGYCKKGNFLCNTNEIIFLFMGTQLSSGANCLGEAPLTALALSWD